MEEKDWLYVMSEQNMLAGIAKTNAYTQQFGLSISEADAKLLVQERANALKEQQRVEFGVGILEKLIFAFCDSAYIGQNNYMDTLVRLQEIFYLYKNESMDQFSDDELLEYMRKAFDDECQGSLDYLEGTCLEKFARWLRQNSHAFIGAYEESE